MHNHVTAEAEVVAACGAGGVTRLPVLRSQVPLVLRRTPDALYLVSAAAGPLGGDQLSLLITVRAGAVLYLRTVAASVALPGPEDGESVLTVTATVEEGGCLEYLPEPVVVADGARHVADVRVRLASGARLLLREELILGRHGESGGRYRGGLRVDYAGRPLLRQCLDVSGTDESSLGPAILSGRRAAGTLLHVDEALALGTASGATRVPCAAALTATLPPGRDLAGRPWATVMPLATGPGTLTTAVADNARELRGLLHAR